MEFYRQHRGRKKFTSLTYLRSSLKVDVVTKLCQSALTSEIRDLASRFANDGTL